MKHIMALVLVIATSGCRDAITNGPKPHDHAGLYKPVGAETSCPAGQVVSGLNSKTGNVVCVEDANTDPTARIKELEASIADLEARHTELEAADYCPRLTAYGGMRRVYTLTSDPTDAGVTRCALGADEMVKVGDFWIDRYEVVLGDAAYWNTGTCDGTGTTYASAGGASPSDDYPTGFPDNGNFTTDIYACSVSGVVPSRMMTWFQAGQACALAGKRICRNDEWQAAVAGTVDPGSSDGADGACVTSAGEPRPTGDGTACRSAWGAEDMIGNLWEWTAMWAVEPGWNGAPSAWMDVSGVSYGSDFYLHGGDATDPVRGSSGSHEVSDGMANSRIPAVVLRGGYWEDGAAAGAFALRSDGGPSNWHPAFATRCCAGGR